MGQTAPFPWRGGLVPSTDTWERRKYVTRKARRNGQSVRNDYRRNPHSGRTDAGQVGNYHDHSTKYRENQRLRQESNRLPARIYIKAYFETHPCVDCGNDDWRVLEFDHVRGEKWRNISSIMTEPLERIIQEIEKCDSVCANCHKIRTYTRAGSWKSGAKGDFVEYL